VINILLAAGMTSTSTSDLPRRRFVATFDQMVPTVFLDQLSDAPNIGLPSLRAARWLVAHRAPRAAGPLSHQLAAPSDRV